MDQREGEEGGDGSHGRGGFSHTVIIGGCDARAHGLRVEGRLGSLFAPVRGERFDVIVATPPQLPAPSRIAVPTRYGGKDGLTLLRRLARAAPNPAHYALAALQRAGRLHAVITQNVDGLHQAAGSPVVIEVHGNLREAVCTGCGLIRPIEVVRAALAAGELPRCDACGDLLKPNVVLFEDLLPQEAWRRATEAARAADVMLVAGSSLQVVPAAYLPEETLDAGGRLIIVNREPTPFDARAAVVVSGEVEQVLPAIASALGTPLVGSRPEAG
jgi:NAD-dependent deacetylase